MEISLKEARRIERRIKDKGIEGNYDLHANISIYSDASTADILTAQQKADNDINNIVALIQARATIRREIQIANEREGINSTISEREANIRMLQVWENVKCRCDNLESADIVIRKLNTALATVESGKGGIYHRSDSVEFVPVSDELAKKAISEARETQLMIDKNDDILSGLNALTKIVITPDVVELLKINNII